MFGSKSKAVNAKPQNVSPAKPKKGPDNNKRLAGLEAKEAARVATNEDQVVPTSKASNKAKVDPAKDHPRAFEAGRRARAANIPMKQAPVMSDAERAAYEKGYG